jgi:chaperonin GroES
MSIKKLIDQIDELNIAESLDETTLFEIASRVKRQFDEDQASMEDWSKTVDEGIKLMKQEWQPKTTPWQGASNYKDPILTEASVKFGDRAKLELLRSDDLVTYRIKGRDFPEKKAAAERVCEAMNYQISCEMPTWRQDQEKLFYSLPNYGSVFKKLVYDPIDEKTDAVVICYPDFAVNQATSSMDECRSFSHVLDFTRNQCVERINSGLWLEYMPVGEMDDENRDGDEGGNEAESVVHANDNPEKFIEQQCFLDLDDDGYEEPYIVTISHKSCKVVRIVARYDLTSVFVNMDGNAVRLDEALEIRQAQREERMGGQYLMGLIGLEPQEEKYDMDIIRIEPFQNVSHYGFIPSPDGTFLHLGYSHLLGALNSAINTHTNQLTDAGTLENLSGGFLSDEFRQTVGLQSWKAGEWKKTKVPADKLAKGIFPKPATPPSQTLYNLLKDNTARAQGYLAVLDVSGQLTAQTAPTTALAMVQEAAIPTSAILSRILDAESKEFEILFRINRFTFDPEKYSQIVGEPADPSQDFSDDFYIVPTANAELSSKTQKIQSALVGIEQLPNVIQLGGDAVALVKNYYDAIDPSLTELVFPDEIPEGHQQQLDQMIQAQNQANQLEQFRLQLLEREQNRLDAETQNEIQTDQAKVSIDDMEAQAKIMKDVASALKMITDAEAQSVESEAVLAGLDKIKERYGSTQDNS